MNYKTKKILILLLGVFLVSASIVDDNIVLRIIFMVLGVIDICISVSMITLYNYNQGYYKDLQIKDNKYGEVKE